MLETKKIQHGSAGDLRETSIKLAFHSEIAFWKAGNLSRKLRRKISFLESLSFQKADLSRKLRNGVVVVIVIIFFLFIYFYYKRGGSSRKSEKGLYNYDR